MSDIVIRVAVGVSDTVGRVAGAPSPNSHVGPSSICKTSGV